MKSLTNLICASGLSFGLFTTSAHATEGASCTEGCIAQAESSKQACEHNLSLAIFDCNDIYAECREGVHPLAVFAAIGCETQRARCETHAEREATACYRNTTAAFDRCINACLQNLTDRLREYDEEDWNILHSSSLGGLPFK